MNRKLANRASDYYEADLYHTTKTARLADKHLFIVSVYLQITATALR
jgi:hypothetical protein